MSVSEKQLAANRANALKSTGPRTPEGKAAIALNNLRHGLFSRLDLLPGEDPEEFEAWTREILDDLNPVGVLEGTIAARIASVSWRIRRASLAEFAVFSPDPPSEISQVESDVPSPPSPLISQVSDSDALSASPSPSLKSEIPKARSGISAPSSPPLSPPLSPGTAWLRRVSLAVDPLGGISRHESRLHRQLSRDLILLEHRQSARLSRQAESLPPVNPMAERYDKWGQRIGRYSIDQDHIRLLELETKLGLHGPDGPPA